MRTQTEVASENDSNAWLAVLPEINKLAHRRDIAVLLIHHTDKAGTSARGSSTITAVPDNLAYLSEVKGHPSTVRQLSYKGRQSKSGSILMDYDPATRTYRKLETPEGAPNTAPSTRPTKPAVSLKSRLTELMRARAHPDGPLYADLRKQRKAKAERVHAELKAMVANGEARKTRDGRAYRYALVSYRGGGSKAGWPTGRPALLHSPASLAEAPPAPRCCSTRRSERRRPP